MREQFNYLLSRQPKIYEGILRLKGNINFEKVLFLNLIRNGDVVFDIGANRGYYTLLFSHLAGKSGRVHAFEPVPATFSRLARMVAAGNRFDNVDVNEVAMGDRTGAVNFYVPGDDDGQASMKKHNVGSWADAAIITPVKCKMIRLDDYVSSRQTSRLDFVKCDVEGAELLVLRGALDSLRELRPILYLEVCGEWTKNFGYSPDEISKHLLTLGYSDFYLVRNNLHRLVNPVDELGPKKFTGSANLLCSIPQLHSRRISAFTSKYPPL